MAAIKDWDGPARTVLGCAGIDKAHLDREDRALEELRRVLKPKQRGRPRKHVSTYFLPVEGLMLLDDANFARKLPRRLRPIIWQIDRQLGKKPGVRLTKQQKMRNITHGFYAPETVRAYRRQLQKSGVAHSPEATRRLRNFNSGSRHERKEQTLNAWPYIAVLAKLKP